MDLLQYGDSSSDDEHSSKNKLEEEVVRVRTWLTDEEDSDDELEDSRKAAKCSSDPKENTMISAEELFSKVISRPGFLNVPSSEAFQVRPTVEEKKIVPKVKAKVISAQPTSVLPPVETDEETPTSVVINEKSTVRDNKKNHLKRKSIAEQSSAKERVKNQRLSGQAGIGADFKEWRSEEEMRMRQHFD